MRGCGRGVKRVLLIEDHTVFRQALAILIDRQPRFRVVAQAGSLAEGLRKAPEGFDLAIADLSVPDADGVDLVAGLRDANPHTGVLGLSRRRERKRYARALGAGANEVISKNAAVEEIIGALKSLSDGETSIFTWDG